MNLTTIELNLPQRPIYFFEVDGEPVACERHRGGRFGNYLPEKTRRAEQKIAWDFKASFPGTPLDLIHFYGARLRFFTNKPAKDPDNLQKTVFDALKGVLWKDDRQVREVYCVVVPNHRPRTEILLYRVNEDYLAKCGESE